MDKKEINAIILKLIAIFIIVELLIAISMYGYSSLYLVSSWVAGGYPMIQDSKSGIKALMVFIGACAIFLPAFMAFLLWKLSNSLLSDRSLEIEDRKYTSVKMSIAGLNIMVLAGLIIFGLSVEGLIESSYGLLLQFTSHDMVINGNTVAWVAGVWLQALFGLFLILGNKGIESFINKIRSVGIK
ncbi:MAG: hypothetical protein OQJ95_09895 [Kangiella sp.]|nr:hypothetical protein [Kangiella sp.]